MPATGNPAKISVLLSVEELRAVVGMLDDQLFRVRFIDPKIPGYQADKDRTRAAEAGLESLKAAGKQYLRPSEHGASDIILPQKAPGASTFHKPQPRQPSVRGRA